MSDEFWKIGELATHTGLSVRTLHYYDEIGLLTPSQRTGSGHRLYTVADVVRLQQIASLRSLGFPLTNIQNMLSQQDCSLHSVLQLHRDRLKEQIENQQQLFKRIDWITEKMSSKEHVSVQELMETIKEIEMRETFEKYYTPQQLEQLNERRNKIGEERMRQSEEEWKVLIQEVQTEMANHTDPASDRMKELATRWTNLIHEFTGGDEGILESLKNMYRHEPNVAASKGYTPDSKMNQFMGEAIQNLNRS